MTFADVCPTYKFGCRCASISLFTSFLSATTHAGLALLSGIVNARTFDPFNKGMPQFSVNLSNICSGDTRYAKSLVLVSETGT